jgi:glutaryl-CoA dehydrogenase (non-decarboxylating)
MELLLDPELTRARREFRAFADRAVAPLADRRDREQKLEAAVVRELAAQHLLAAELAAEHGGRGLDALGLGLLMEELGRSCSSVRSLATVHGMVAHTLARWGTREQRETWLPRLGRGEWLAALAVTEPLAGSDLASVQTRAVRDGDDYVVTGDKRWITCGQIADGFLVLAASDAGPIALLVRSDAPGLAIEPIHGMLGTRGSMLAALQLRACRVPATAVVGRPGLGLSWIIATALDHGRFTVAWGAVGIAQACLEASLRHAMSRSQFGAPLVEHQLVRRMLSEMTADTRAARLVCLHAARLRQSRHTDSVAETSLAKHVAARTAMRVAHDAVQIHGALGCSDERSVERHFRDAKVMEIIEGSNEMHQIHITDLAIADLSALDADHAEPR